MTKTIKIECLNHLLWSSNPNTIRETFYVLTSQGRIKKPFIFGSSYQTWSADPRVVRRLLYDQCLQGNKENNSLELFKETCKSLCEDKEKITLSMKKRLKPFVCCDELNALLDSKSYICGNYQSNNSKYLPVIVCKDVIILDEDILPFEDVYKSLITDHDKVINGLSYRLKEYVCKEEVKMLMDVKSCAEDNARDSPQLDSLISRILDFIKMLLEYISFGLYKNRCNHSTNVQCDIHNQSEMKCVEYKYQPSIDYNSEGDSALSTDLNVYENQSPFETQANNKHSFKKGESLYNVIAEFTRYQNQLLREKRLKEVATYEMLLRMRKANSMLRRETYHFEFF